MFMIGKSTRQKWIKSNNCLPVLSCSAERERSVGTSVVFIEPVVENISVVDDPSLVVGFEVEDGDGVVGEVDGGGCVVDGAGWVVDGAGWEVDGGGWVVDGGGCVVDGGGCVVDCGD